MQCMWPATSDTTDVPADPQWSPGVHIHEPEDHDVFGQSYAGIRTFNSLQMHPRNHSGTVIENSNVLQPSQQQDQNPESMLSFHNIHYAVKQRYRRSICNTESYFILKGVSAIMRPGINAIIGPSGSGKTALLDMLFGKKEGSGFVLLDGKRQQRDFKFKCGYVVQHDLITSTLTVRENIAFSAFVRMSADITKEYREKRINDVLEKMKLEECAHTKIGDNLFRGVSGGERKRTSIGMELVTDPKILFLDEPTTGLDAATALQVMETLADISLQDRKIIIMTIHQPRYSIYKLIDQLTLISKGEVVYHGKRSEATKYFRQPKLGYKRNPEDNPADFLVDAIIDNENKQGRSNVSSLPYLFKLCEEGTNLKGELDDLLESINESGTNSSTAFATSTLRQFQGLSIRNLKTLGRHPQATFTLSIIMTVLAFVVGTIFFQREDEFSGLQDRFGSFFFSILVMDYLNLAAMDLFIQQRAVFIHEKESGFYRVSAYFISKLLCDLLPMTIIPVPLYCGITYSMIGLRQEAMRFFRYMLALMLLNFSVGSLALAIGAAIGKFSIANPIYVMVLVISMVFSGFLISLRNVVAWLRWIQYLSVFKYCINILAVNEFEGQIYCNRDYNNITEQYDCIEQFTRSGDDFLEEMGYLDYNVWFNHLGLVIHGIFYLILAYVFLRMLKTR